MGGLDDKGYASDVFNLSLVYKKFLLAAGGEQHTEPRQRAGPAVFARWYGFHGP